jgi:hypothetical protein
MLHQTRGPVPVAFFSYIEPLLTPELGPQMAFFLVVIYLGTFVHKMNQAQMFMIAMGALHLLKRSIF